MKIKQNYLDYDEKKILEQNEHCIYCYGKNTYFMRFFSSVCRINSNGEPTVITNDGSLTVVKTKEEARRMLYAVLSEKTAVTKGLWVICRDCGKQREIELNK